MKRLLILALALSSIGTAAQQLNAPTFETYITVDTAVVPDKINMEIRLNELDLKSKETLQEKERQMLRRLEDLGIDIPQQLSVTELGSNLKVDLFGREDILKRKKYALVVDDAQLAGDVIIALEKENIANVTVQSTEILNTDALENALIEKAMKKAFAQMESANKYTKMRYSKVRSIRVDQPHQSYATNRVAGLSLNSKAYDAEQEQWSPSELSFEKQEVKLKIWVVLELERYK